MESTSDFSYLCPSEFGDEKALLTLRNDGFSFDGRVYGWSDVVHVRRRDSLFWRLFLGLVPGPLTYIMLADKTRICLLQNVTEVGRLDSLSLPIRFGIATSQEYKDLVHLFLRKMRKEKGERVSPWERVSP